MNKIILASQSPRRKELLAQMGLVFTTVPSKFDEHLDDSRTPQEVAMELALGKALDVADDYPDSIVIGADTIVTVDGKQLEKPVDETDAYRLLELLSGKPNDVTTGLVIIRKSDGVRLLASDTTTVYFKPYDETAVRAYVASGDTADKAGAYGIQSGAAPLIDHIEGHYDTVVGLPTHLLAELLTELGITAQPVELESPVPQII